MIKVTDIRKQALHEANNHDFMGVSIISAKDSPNNCAVIGRPVVVDRRQEHDGNKYVMVDVCRVEDVEILTGDIHARALQLHEARNQRILDIHYSDTGSRQRAGENIPRVDFGDQRQRFLDCLNEVVAKEFE